MHCPHIVLSPPPGRLPFFKKKKQRRERESEKHKINLFEELRQLGGRQCKRLHSLPFYLKGLFPFLLQIQIPIQTSDQKRGNKGKGTRIFKEEKPGDGPQTEDQERDQ